MRSTVSACPCYDRTPSRGHHHPAGTHLLHDPNLDWDAVRARALCLYLNFSRAKNKKNNKKDFAPPRPRPRAARLTTTRTRLLLPPTATTARKKKFRSPLAAYFPSLSLSLFPVAWPAGGAAKRAAPVSSEHENLPIESDLDGSNNNNNGQESSCAGNIYEGCNEPAKEVDGRSLSVSGDLHSANETTIPNLEPPEIHAEQEKDNATIKCDLPCEGWLKRKSNCLSHRMKGVTTVCTIVAAGALMGFVIIGQRWQQDKLHLHHFQFNIGTEGVNRIVGIFSRCKDALPSSQQLKSLLPTRVLPQEPLSA
uniref:Uncharacterized protein n=1 Tax=Oryza rufipogon TaxID=4529 RepID=A0A0E0Q783_ORYRU